MPRALLRCAGRAGRTVRRRRTAARHHRRYGPAMARTPRPRPQPRRGPSPGSAGSRRRTTAPPRRGTAPKGLGGDQVEGRQAVRELLLAGRRKVRELWVATEDGERGPSDLVALAADLRIPVQHVSRKRLDAEA